MMPRRFAIEPGSTLETVLDLIRSTITSAFGVVIITPKWVELIYTGGIRGSRVIMTRAVRTVRGVPDIHVDVLVKDDVALRLGLEPGPNGTVGNFFG